MKRGNGLASLRNARRSCSFPRSSSPFVGRPVVNVSFALNYAFGGLDVRGYHVVNVAIHIALLLFGIVWRTLGLPALRDRFPNRSADLAFAAALIWMVHPLQTDAVDYVTQRTELMLGLFYLLTLYASIRGHEQTKWLVVASCVLGMASEKSMVTAPLMILVYHRVFVFNTLKETWQRRWRFYVSLEPADVAAEVQLGIAYAALGRQNDAIAQFRRVVDLNPQDAVAHRNLARALLEKGNVDEAVVELRRAVELNPADARVRGELEAVLRPGTGSTR